MGVLFLVLMMMMMEKKGLTWSRRDRLDSSYGCEKGSALGRVRFVESVRMKNGFRFKTQAGLEDSSSVEFRAHQLSIRSIFKFESRCLELVVSVKELIS